MQNIYAQHSFRGVVNYLIAPATGIVYPCFNIRGIINFLKAGITLKNPQISNYIVESFRKDNVDYEQHKDVIEEFIVVSFN
ncbi:MAG: hypothetical protein IPL50_05635 [Chitinophagaceae bacterium]|nr:hypothetical protein [Chitinophagaceae bacterium]